jgi:alpha-mannosidase
VAIVPLDAPLASFGDISRGDWPGEFRPKSATLFSYAMNNYSHTSYRAARGGEFTFRYVLTSGATVDPAALSRLALESMRPPEVNHVVGQGKPGNPERPLPPDGASFLATDQPNVVMWKRAEDGNGAVIRLRETSGKAIAVHIRLPHDRIQSASLCNAVEDDLRPLPINAEGAAEVPVGA